MPAKKKPEGEYEALGRDLGALVDSKQEHYGDAFGKAGQMLAVLYPDGIEPHQYRDVAALVRIMDKLGRISQRGPDGHDKGGESPYRDIAGYGLLGQRADGAKS